MKLNSLVLSLIQALIWINSSSASMMFVYQPQGMPTAGGPNIMWGGPGGGGQTMMGYTPGQAASAYTPPHADTTPSKPLAPVPPQTGVFLSCGERLTPDQIKAEKKAHDNDIRDVFREKDPELRRHRLSRENENLYNGTRFLAQKYKCHTADDRFKKAVSEDARKYLKHEMKNLVAQSNLAKTYANGSKDQFTPFLVLNYTQAKAEAIRDFASGVTTGFYKGYYDAAKTMRHIASNPGVVASLANSIMWGLSHPERMLARTKGAWFAYYHMMNYGTPQEQGEYFGKLAAEITLGMVGAKVTAPLHNAVGAIANDMVKTGLGKNLAEKIIPQLEKKLAKDIAVVKDSIAKERILPPGWQKGKRITGYKDSNLHNQELKKAFDLQPPYAKDTQVIFFDQRAAEHTYAHVHNASNRVSRWLVEPKSIEGLSPQQIKLKLNLPEVPSMVTDVVTPKDTKFSFGRSGYVDFKLEPRLDAKVIPDVEGAMQYRIEGKMKDVWFKNTRELPRGRE